MTKNNVPVPANSDPVEKVRAFLREKGYPDQITISEETIFTVEDASRAVGAPPAHILKSLVFIADERPVLALMSGVNKVNPKEGCLRRKENQDGRPGLRSELVRIPGGRSSSGWIPGGGGGLS